MRLNLQTIIHSPGMTLPFAFQMDLSDVEIYSEKPVTNPVEVSGEVRNLAGVLELKAVVVTDLDLVCDRCLKTFRKEKKVVLDYLLAQELQDEEAEENILLLEGSELDIEELASTSFILDMDTKTLCSEDCEGLCDGCGVNLNEEACRCQPEVDPRWAALSQLLDKPE